MISEANSILKMQQLISGEVSQPAPGHTAGARIGWIQVCVLPNQCLPVPLHAL